MTSKETFLQNENDVKFLLSVIGNPAFDRAVIYAKQHWQEASFLKDPATPISTVNSFLEALRDLPHTPPVDAPSLQPKINRNLDIPTVRKQRTPKEKVNPK